MIDRTTLLFALPGFRVLNVTPEADGGRLVLVENSAKEGGCPSCGVMSARIKDRPLCRQSRGHVPVDLEQNGDHVLRRDGKKHQLGRHAGAVIAISGNLASGFEVELDWVAGPRVCDRTHTPAF